MFIYLHLTTIIGTQIDNGGIERWCQSMNRLLGTTPEEVDEKIRNDPTIAKLYCGFQFFMWEDCFGKVEGACDEPGSYQK